MFWGRVEEGRDGMPAASRARVSMSAIRRAVGGREDSASFAREGEMAVLLLFWGSLAEEEEEEEGRA